MQEQSPFVDFRGPLIVSSKFLKVLGLWFEGEAKFSCFDLYTAYSILILTCSNLEYFSEIAYWCVEPFDFEKLVLAGVVLFTKVQTGAKVFCMIKYRSVAKRFVSECNEKMFQPKTKGQKSKADNVLKLYKLVCVTYGITVLCVNTLNSLVPLIGNNKEENVLPYFAWFPYNSERYFWPTFGYQFVACTVLAQTHVHVDSFFIGLLAFIIVQCDILIDSLTNAKNMANISLEPSRRRDLTHEEVVVQTEKNLYNCIAHHKDILRWFREIHNMLSLMIFTQFAATTLSICLALFQASITDPSDPNWTAMLTYAIGMSGQLFLLSWWGNEVSTKSAQIPTAAFHCNWPEMSKKARRDLLTFIHFTQTPLEVFGAGYFKLSLDNFLLILKNSYSYFTVLRSMRP